MDISEDEIVEYAKKFKENWSDELRDHLIKNNKLSKESLLSLYYEGLINAEFFKKFSEEFDISSEVNLQTINELYTFSRFTCTNDVTGDFDTKEWKFLPKNEEESTCELYFVKAKYEVTLTITGSNATLDENNPKYVAREQDGQFIIKPTEGYVFDKTTCSDNKQTSWKKKKNTLTISSVTKDVSCTVSFKLKELTVNINVKNGEGSTTKTVNYGESIKEVVTPKAGFGTPTIKCSSSAV